MGMPLRSLNHATRTPLKLRSRGRAKRLPGSLMESGVLMSGPAMVLSARARSAAGAAEASVGPERRPTEVVRGIGHAADGGTEADDIAPGGRIAEGPAGVRAAGDRHHAAGERDRCTAGGAAASFRQVVRVARCAEDTVEGLRAGTELGDVGFAEEDGAGGAHARDEQVVLCGDVVFEEGRAEGGADAGGFEEVLVRDGQTMQRTEDFATRLHLVGAGCGCGGLVRDQA